MIGDELKVTVENLRRACNPGDFLFRDTSEVQPIQGFIGQERAVEALRFGLNINQRGYNIIVTGNTGKGQKKSVLAGFIKEFVKEKTAQFPVVLKDVCYLYNFENPERPIIVFLEKGRGRKLKKDMKDAFGSVKKGIPALFRSKQYLSSVNNVSREFRKVSGALLESLKKEAGKLNLVFQQAPEGFEVELASEEIGPGGDPQPMKQKEHDNLSDDEKAQLDRARETFEQRVQETSQKIEDLKLKADQKADKASRQAVKKFLDRFLRDFYEEYADYPKVINYLNSLKEYILNNADLFYSQPREQDCLRDSTPENFFLPFAVNLFVDNSGNDFPPVLIESNPTFSSLFCAIDKKYNSGAYYIDHTCLRAGSLALANGGYLILNIWDILENFGIWQNLKKILRQGILEIEEPFSALGGLASSISPEPMPVSLKVIVVGKSYLYDLLAQYDPDFLSTFKVKVEFDSEMPLTEENKESYAGFISACCQEENLLPFDAAAVAKIVEQGARMAESQIKLSTKLDEIKDLIIESNYWAAQDGMSQVQSQHIKKAVESQKARLDLAEKKVKEAFDNNLLLIATDGEKIGQINGLVVRSRGDYSFGMPIRITAVSFSGSKGLVSIQREVKLSGQIHDTGVLTLQGYFSQEYGKFFPISFSASISFEQCYGGIEGDSASAAELISLISSLSEIPINQSFAITGSVNQKGEIQPIGGVNEKIEGFFDVCMERGLTGKQAVIIPCQNIQHLMLREDVVEAVRNGMFSVYSIETVDQGLEVLMGLPAGKIGQAVRDRLKAISAKKDK